MEVVVAQTVNNGNTITGTSVDVPRLTNGTEYKFQVRAVNSTGEGTETDAVTATPRAPIIIVLRAPSAPRDLSASSREDGQSTLSWTEPLSSGTSPIERYEYRYATGHYPNHSAWIDWTSTGSTSTSYTVTGLTNGTQHLLQVRAVNSVNPGPASNTAFATPQPPAPVWNDIPDTIYRAIGESLNLDLSSYVSGSPTITRTAGTIPAGLALSNGVLSGTPTTIETRELQFTATNTAGTAQSESVTIIIRPLRIRNIPESDLTMTRNQPFSLDLNQFVVSDSPTTLSIIGTLPTGISLNNGTLSGTPTGTKTAFLIGIIGTNSHGSHSRLYVIIVND